MEQTFTKDQNLDKIFWFKLIISITTAVGYGYFNVTGFLSFVLFVLGLTIISLLYFRKFINNDDDVDYQGEVFIEGLNVAIPVFLLVWILSCTINKMSRTIQFDMPTISTQIE